MQGHLLHNIKPTGQKNQQIWIILVMIKNHDVMVEQWKQWCDATCDKILDLMIEKKRKIESLYLRLKIMSKWIWMKIRCEATCYKIPNLMVENMCEIESV